MSVRLYSASAEIRPEGSVYGTASGLAARVYLDPEADRWLESGDPASLRDLAAVLLASAADLEDAKARQAAENVPRPQESDGRIVSAPGLATMPGDTPGPGDLHEAVAAV